MIKRKFILAENEKAKKYLLELGATLTPGKRTKRVDDLYYNVGVIYQDVYYVSGDPFDAMTPNQFSGFLRKNKLSVYQRD